MAQTLQHRRRIGSLGAPPSLLVGQFGVNDPGGAALPSLYVGTPTVKTLVSDTRQVEITGVQTITGDKTIDVARLHILGGADGDVLSTDGVGNLAWVEVVGAVEAGLWGVGVWGTAIWGGAGGIPEAPTTGRIYARRGSDASWQVTLPEAPADGQLYARNGLAGAWVVAPSGPGGGIGEAPLIGGPFVRQLGAWTDVIDDGIY